MLHDAFERLPGQVEPRKATVAGLQFGHHPQALLVVIEAACVPGQPVEGLFAGVAERWVAEVVGQRDGLRQVLVDAQRPGDRLGHLSDLEGVGESGAVVIALIIYEHLGFVLQAPKGAGMDHAVVIF